MGLPASKLGRELPEPPPREPYLLAKAVPPPPGPPQFSLPPEQRKAKTSETTA